MPDVPPISDQPLAPDAAIARPGRVAGSSQTRVMLIVGAVVGFLVVIGVVIALVLMNLGKKAVEQAAVNTLNTTLTATATPAATRTVETTSEGTKLTLPVTNQDVFVSRDPFTPVLKELPKPVETTSAAIPERERNVLVLQDIVSTNGEYRAILKWDGVVNANVAPGQVLVGRDNVQSPWKVLTITKTTCTLLYGDVQVTLSIGEGVEKD